MSGLSRRRNNATTATGNSQSSYKDRRIQHGDSSSSSDDDLVIISTTSKTTDAKTKAVGVAAAGKPSAQEDTKVKSTEEKTRKNSGRAKQRSGNEEDKPTVPPEQGKLEAEEQKPFPVSEDEDKVQLDLLIQPAPSETNLDSLREDTLLELEAQLGRRLDDSSQFNLDQPASSSVPPELVRQVVCPFCWKKLHDKLTGMRHVKVCGSNLPTTRIFEALQLHEKQIKEWEQIGISYPGFQNNPAGKSTAAKENGESKPRARGNRRAKPKKEEAEDPEMALALALSASLHENIVEREKAEKNYLIDIGLGNEVVQEPGAPPTEKEKTSHRSKKEAISEFRLRFSKESKAKLQKGTSTTGTAVVKTRRTKTKATDLKSTKLFTTSEEEKALILSERISEILENNENAQIQEPYKLTSNNVLLTSGTNKRLDAHRSDDHHLWKLSSTMDSMPKTTFYTPALIDCKEKMEKYDKEKQESAESQTSSTSAVNVKSSIQSEIMKNTQQNPFNHPKELVPVPLPRPITSLKKIRPSESFSNPPAPRAPNRNRLPSLAQDFLKLFTHKIGTDIVLYGREEKAIRAHKIILQVRCPRLLGEIVIEETSAGRSELIPLTCFSHLVVKSFVWYLYSSQLPFESSSEKMARYYEEMEEIANKYGIVLDEFRTCTNVTAKDLVSKDVQTVQLDYLDKSIQTESTIPFHSTPAYSPHWEDDYADCHEKTCSQKSDVNFLDEIEDRISLTTSLDEMINRNSNGTSTRRRSVDSRGSVDLFEDFDEKDEAQQADPELFDLSQTEAGNAETSLKKRSRSTSPSLGRSFQIPSSFEQANKKYKLDHTSRNNDREINSALPNEFDDRKSLSDFMLDEISTPPCDSTRVTRSRLCNNDVTTIRSEASPISRFSGVSKISGRVSLGRILDLEHHEEGSSPTDDRPSDDPNFPDPYYTSLDPLYNFNEDHLLPYEQDEEEAVVVHEDVDDGVWNGIDDDSIFAKIPQEFLNPVLSPRPRMSTHKNPSNNRRRCSSPSDDDDEELSPIKPQSQPILNVNVSKKSNSNLNAGKSRCKIKIGGTTAAASGATKKKTNNKNGRKNYEENLATFNNREDNNSTNFSQAQKTPTQNVLGVHSQVVASNANQTPLLNYSTIDTPILKKELKKYGLKPLPRTKAKLLLRHIYKETHKSYSQT